MALSYQSVKKLKGSQPKCNIQLVSNCNYFFLYGGQVHRSWIEKQDYQIKKLKLEKSKSQKSEEIVKRDKIQVPFLLSKSQSFFKVNLLIDI